MRAFLLMPLALVVAGCSAATLDAALRAVDHVKTVCEDGSYAWTPVGEKIGEKCAEIREGE